MQTNKINFKNWSRIEFKRKSLKLNACYLKNGRDSTRKSQEIFKLFTTKKMQHNYYFILFADEAKLKTRVMFFQVFSDYHRAMF